MEEKDMKTKNLRKAIALGISSMVMTGLLTYCK